MSKHVSFASTATAQAVPSSNSILLLGQSTTTKRLSASCQQVLLEEYTADIARVVVRSCLADSQLYPIVAGHICNKNAIVPSALNSDMALVVGQHIWSTLRPRTELPGLNVADVHVPKSMLAQVPQKDGGQWLQMEANATLNTDTTLGEVKCNFYSVHPDGTKIADHATCTLKYESKAQWRKEWSRYSHMVQASIKALHAKALTGEANRMQPGLAYKVFASFVDYTKTYYSMDEVIFDGLEGTATVTFKTSESDYCPPYHLDGSCHVSGFLCNASDMDGENVFISEGWDSAKIMDLEMLQRNDGKKITNYVRMQEQPKQILEGDIYVFKDDEVVQVWEGVRFKRVPRKVINMLLPRPNT